VVLSRAALIAAAALAQAGAEPRGSIRGRVDVQLELPVPEPRPAVGALGMPEPADPPDRRRSVVYLESAPQRAFEEPPPRRVTLDQRGQAFVPYVLPITVGTTVDFPNHDRTYHNVFSFSKPGRFDLGRYGQGASKSVRFDRPGVVRVFCDIHSHMRAFILVFAHRFFAATDAQGRYRIDEVPPGGYELVVWTDGQERARRALSVPRESGPVEADFVVK
jgi:plastocyanin